MSSNTSEAATTALDQQERDDQTANAGPESQGNSTATPNQDSRTVTPSNQGQEAQQQTATSRQQDDNNPAAPMGQSAQGGQPADSGQGIQNIADITGGTDPHADDTAKMASEPKPDVSDQDYQELLPKLLNYFHNNREELARAIGLHRSTVDRWLNGKSRPNNSTVLRMRRIAQERRIE